MCIGPGIYFDGKKSPTLVNETTETEVLVNGRRKTVKTNRQVINVVDHYPLVSYPSGEYISHITPADGSGLALATAIVKVVKDRDANVKVLGMDGCPVNTGKSSILMTESHFSHIL